jgi:hypothetical protein
VFSRYQGTFEITFWLESVYELIDFRVSLLQFTGGYNRWIRPQFFWTSIIVPEEFQNYTKEDGNKIDWGNTYAQLLHVDSINKHKLCIPIALDPIWRLESFADASTKYGGDQIAEYKLSASFGYEVNIPTYMVLSRGIDPRLCLSFSIGRTYTKYPLVSPFKILQSLQQYDTTEKYVSKFFKLFVFENKEDARSKLIGTFSPDTVSFPDKIPTWNYIASGRLIEITKTWLQDPQNIVHKNDIVYFDSYVSEFLPSIRNCRAVISRKDIMSSDVYQKCEIMKKSLLCYLSNDEVHMVKRYVGKNITLDTLNRKIYDGLLAVVEADKNDPEAGYSTVSQVQKDDVDMYNKSVKDAEDKEPINFIGEVQAGKEYADQLTKRLIKDKCDGIQTKFYFSFVLDDTSLENLLIYVDNDLMKMPGDFQLVNRSCIVFTVPPPYGSSVYIGGKLLTLRDSSLIAVYEFTAADVKSLEKIIVKLSNPIDRQEDLVLVSYSGRLEYEKDYFIDSDLQTISIALAPIDKEIIEFFLYV